MGVGAAGRNVLAACYALKSKPLQCLERLYSVLGPHFDESCNLLGFLYLV